MKASHRFTAAVRASLDAEQHVDRFLALADFDAVVKQSFVVMEQEVAVWQKLARDSSDSAKALAESATAIATQAFTVMPSYEAAVIDTHNLVVADAARAQLESAIAQINQLTKQWKKLK